MGLGPVLRGVEGSWGWGLADGAVLLQLVFKSCFVVLFVCVCCVNDSSMYVCLPLLLYILCFIFYILFFSLLVCVHFNLPFVYIFAVFSLKFRVHFCSLFFLIL